MELFTTSICFVNIPFSVGEFVKKINKRDYELVAK